MHIPKYDTQNNPFCRFKLVLKTLEHSTYWLTKQNSKESPKLLRMNKRIWWNFGDQCNKQPIVSSILVKNNSPHKQSWQTDVHTYLYNYRVDSLWTILTFDGRVCSQNFLAVIKCPDRGMRRLIILDATK